MKADNESLNNRGRPLRRSNSSGNLANRLGPRRPTVGGAAQRVAKRNLDRQRGRNSGGGALSGRGRSAAGPNNRGRSRSRSRTRIQPGNNLRYRSRTRYNADNPLNNRSRSRNRYANTPLVNNNARRGRSRSRSRGLDGVTNKSTSSIKARLGIRPGTTANRGLNNRRRNASLSRRGVQTGRVQKRRNSTSVTASTSDNSRRGRMRSR